MTSGVAPSSGAPVRLGTAGLLRGAGDASRAAALWRAALDEPLPPALPAGARRLAVNTIIQGTAADVMKLAMISSHQALARSVW